MPSPEKSGSDKNEGLQAARAIAALSVAYFHSYIALRAFPDDAQRPIEFLKAWGFLGVNLFFAISGFVICLVVTKDTFTLRSFATKRFFRLYPMYWVAMAVILVMIWNGHYRSEPADHFLYSMTLLPQNGPSAYDPSWTLERELVFYILAAITIPLLGVVGLAIVLAILAYVGLQLGNPWSFHLVSTTQADFLGGVLVFLISQRLRCDTFWASLTVGVGALFLWYTRSHDFAFSATISFAVILFGLVNLQLPWRHWSLSWITFLGDASYSIYLLHYLVFANVVYKPLEYSMPPWICEPFRFAAIAWCCAISYATWHVIEEPFIALGNRIAKARRAIGSPLPQSR